MEPETDEKREAREARLKALCEPLGLETQGSWVRPKDDDAGPVLDASVIDTNQLVPHLLKLAYMAGQQDGARKARAEIRARTSDLMDALK